MPDYLSALTIEEPEVSVLCLAKFGTDTVFGRRIHPAHISCMWHFLRGLITPTAPSQSCKHDWRTIFHGHSSLVCIPVFSRRIEDDRAKGFCMNITTVSGLGIVTCLGCIPF
jgi:hypothetical protein